MRKMSVIIFSLFIILTTNNFCNSGTKHSHQEIKKNNIAVDTLKNREAVFAGSFYPGSAQQLNSMLDDLFEQAEKPSIKNPSAIIVPHAGYVFSGKTAASAYNQITNPEHYERVFILASSHRVAFQGASIYSIGNYETPLGEVKVDFETARELMDKSRLFSFQPQAHAQEHSLEVQLPFLQKIFGTSLKIVPIILGTQSPETCKKLAETLKPYFNGKNLFVISSDFSHYPEYEDAIENDRITADAICSNSPQKLLSTIKENSKKNIPGLATSLCGWTSVLTLLYITHDMENVQFHKIDYSNSGDSPYGDKNQVVGYTAIAVEMKSSQEDNFDLSQEEKKQLLSIARSTLEAYLKDQQIPEINEKNLSKNLLKPCGAFVTLNKEHRLRGCIGRFITDKPLYKTVQDMAIAAALYDSRFPSVSPDELDEIEIEISVLSPLKRINSIDEFELGKHGIYIKKGYHSGTFLPQVAQETNWTKEEFISHCARDKAGIGWDGWKDPDCELYIYTAIVFSE